LAYRDFTYQTRTQCQEGEEEEETGCVAMLSNALIYKVDAGADDGSGGGSASFHRPIGNPCLTEAREPVQRGGSRQLREEVRSLREHKRQEVPIAGSQAKSVLEPPPSVGMNAINALGNIEESVMVQLPFLYSTRLCCICVSRT
jgi:hypothetical protein